MIGGAGGAYQELFNDFEANYAQLRDLLREKTWIQGIDLDIEEPTKMEVIQKLMDRLMKDFGDDLISNYNHYFILNCINMHRIFNSVTIFNSKE